MAEFFLTLYKRRTEERGGESFLLAIRVEEYYVYKSSNCPGGIITYFFCFVKYFYFKTLNTIKICAIENFLNLNIRASSLLSFSKYLFQPKSNAKNPDCSGLFL